MKESRQVIWFLFLLSFVLRVVEQTRFTIAFNQTMLTAQWFFILLDLFQWATRKLKERQKR